MTAIRVRKDHFSGTSKVFSREPDALAAILRGMAIDNARTRLIALDPSGVTDNSTGTAADPYVLGNPPIAPSGVFNATSAGGVLASAFNTSLGKIANAHAVFAGTFNPVLAMLGLPQITYASGTIASAGTVPAQDLTATTGAGDLAVNNASYIAGAEVMAANHRLIARAFVQIMDALVGVQGAGPGFPPAIVQGIDPLAQSFETPFNPSAPITSFTPTGLTTFGPKPQYLVLAATPTVVVDSTGADSVLLADGTAFLAAMADNMATMAAGWNHGVIGATLTSLTDNSGGTSAQEAVNAIALPVAYTSAGTDLAPKAGFDAQLAIYANAQASLAARLNTMAVDQGFGLIVTDNSGGSPSTTMAAMSSSLSAVTLGSGSGVAYATALTSWEAVVNNFSTLIALANKMAQFYELPPLTDNTGGTPSLGTPAFVDEAGYTEVPMESHAAVNPVLVVVPATGTAISTGTLDGVANTAADAFLAEGMNAVSTLTAFLNQMRVTTATGRPLNVVAK